MLHASVRQDGREGGPAVRVLHTSLLRPGQWDWQRTSRDRLGVDKADHRAREWPSLGWLAVLDLMEADS